MSDRSVVPVQHANDTAGSNSLTPCVLLQWPYHSFHLSIFRQKENYLNGGFIFYVERNQNLKDNFENHTER